MHKFERLSEIQMQMRKPLPPAGLVYGKAEGETVRAPRFAKFLKVFKINPLLFQNDQKTNKTMLAWRQLLNFPECWDIFKNVAREKHQTKTTTARAMRDENGTSKTYRRGEWQQREITRALRHERDLFEGKTATKKKMRQLSGSSTREEAAEHQKSKKYKHVPKSKCKCEGHCPPRA